MIRWRASAGEDLAAAATALARTLVDVRPAKVVDLAAVTIVSFSRH
jgi:hypothetical protein